MMKILKIRRVGNSNVITMPRDLEAHGFGPGCLVIIDQVHDGELRVRLESDVRSRIRDVGREVLTENREALALLEQHDREDSSAIAAG